MKVGELGGRGTENDNRKLKIIKVCYTHKTHYFVNLLLINDNKMKKISHQITSKYKACAMVAYLHICSIK